MHKQKAFTLIELLVVIAIIGLLSSIVLVATKETTERAKIAVVLQFSAQVHHALGAYAVVIWDFNDQQNPTKDASGYNNHGTLTNMEAADWKCDPSDTIAGRGCALEFDGESKYVDLGSNNVLDLTSDLTISAWIKTTNITERQAIYDRSIQIDGSHYGIVFSIKGWSASDGEISYFTNNFSGQGDWYSSDGKITANKWHFVVVAVDADSGGQFYIDGNNAGTWSNSHSDAASIDHNAEIGRDYQAVGNNNIFMGLIDDVRIYSGTLTSAQIKQFYTQGAEKHGLLVKK